MSKWALFSAHRYIQGDTNERTVRADGRPLLRPWRVWSPAVIEESARRRAARTQPRWPHPLGWMLIGIAGVAVIEADYSIPRHVQASSTVSGPRLIRLQAESPAGPGEGVPDTFRWNAGDVPPPYTVVLLGDGCTEFARVEDLGGPTWTPHPGLSSQLGRGGVFQWFVEGVQDGVVARSGLQTFEIR